MDMRDLLTGEIRTISFIGMDGVEVTLRIIGQHEGFLMDLLPSTNTIHHELVAVKGMRMQFAQGDIYSLNIK